MNNIQNYNITSGYRYSNDKSPNFKCKNMPLLREGIMEKAAKAIDFIDDKFGPKLIKIKPAESYDELYKLIKSEYRFAKLDEFFGRMAFSFSNFAVKIIATPFKDIRKTLFSNNGSKEKFVQERIEAGYKYVQENRDHLDKLTYDVYGILGAGRPSPYLKGMLKALKELGLVKLK